MTETRNSTTSVSSATSGTVHSSATNSWRISNFIGREANASVPSAMRTSSPKHATSAPKRLLVSSVIGQGEGDWLIAIYSICCGKNQIVFLERTVVLANFLDFAALGTRMMRTQGDNKHFHFDCFTCVKCPPSQNQIGELPFTRVGGDFVCQKCYKIEHPDKECKICGDVRYYSSQLQSWLKLFGQN